ncbi:MAG: hypothetical protein HFJ65_08450 [Eggerthellaceae bacterium]|nr:hypothetical protein [Eggerthellaceae bacterium]
MSEDLGQDVAEYVLNQRNEFFRYAQMFINAVRSGTREYVEPSRSNAAEKVVALDFETADDAEAVSYTLNGRGYENYRVAASVIMKESDLESAAAECSEIAELIKAKVAQEKANVEKDTTPPDKLEEVDINELPKATEKQIAFIEKLHEDGHLRGFDIENLRNSPSYAASEIIKRGIAIRDIKQMADNKQLRVKDVGEEARESAERLVKEKSGRAQEKVIERNLTR